VEGVSPRKVKEVTEELCGTTFSKSLISSLAGSLDSELSAWRKRRLEAEAYPYLFVDARYEKVRVDSRVVSQGVLVVSGVREDGFREILAVEVADTESEAPTRSCSGPRSDEGFREWSWWSQMTTKA
jgi:putative transposase